jgi:hypothetical protein
MSPIRAAWVRVLTSPRKEARPTRMAERSPGEGEMNAGADARSPSKEVARCSPACTTCSPGHRPADNRPSANGRACLRRPDCHPGGLSHAFVPKRDGLGGRSRVRRKLSCRRRRLAKTCQAGASCCNHRWKETPAVQADRNGRGWDRTSDPSRVKSLEGGIDEDSTARYSAFLGRGDSSFADPSGPYLPRTCQELSS